MKKSLARKRSSHFIKTNKSVYKKTLYFRNVISELDKYLKAHGF